MRRSRLLPRLRRQFLRRRVPFELKRLCLCTGLLSLPAPLIPRCQLGRVCTAIEHEDGRATLGSHALDALADVLELRQTLAFAGDHHAVLFRCFVSEPGDVNEDKLAGEWMIAVAATCNEVT